MDELKQFADLCDAQKRSIECYAKQLNSLKDAIEAAVLAEREACAKLVEQYYPESFYLGQMKEAAHLIRGRGLE